VRDEGWRGTNGAGGSNSMCIVFGLERGENKRGKEMGTVKEWRDWLGSLALPLQIFD